MKKSVQPPSGEGIRKAQKRLFRELIHAATPVIGEDYCAARVEHAGLIFQSGSWPRLPEAVDEVARAVLRYIDEETDVARRLTTRQVDALRDEIAGLRVHVIGEEPAGALLEAVGAMQVPTEEPADVLLFSWPAATQGRPANFYGYAMVAVVAEYTWGIQCGSYDLWGALARMPLSEWKSSAGGHVLVYTQGAAIRSMVEPERMAATINDAILRT